MTLSLKTKQKIGNILAYNVISSPDMGRIKHVKALCVTDIVSYNLFLKMITGDTYYVLPKGPMGTIAGDLTKETNEFLDVTPQAGEYEPYRYEPRRTPALEEYSLQDRVIIEGSRRWVQSQTADSISHITHQLSLWKNKLLQSKIPNENFRLSDEECTYLEEKGILITGFGRNMGSVTTQLPACLSSLDYDDLDGILTQLIKTFPTDLWGEYDDCFLACMDALRETSQTEEASTLVKPICDRGAAMTAALVYTPSLTPWVRETLKPYTEFFDKAATDAIGVSEDLQSEPDPAVDSLMAKLRQNAMNAIGKTE